MRERNKTPISFSETAWSKLGNRTVLTPGSLGEVFPQYALLLEQSWVDPLLWATPWAFNGINQGKNILVGVMGASASGKDSVLRLAQTTYPHYYFMKNMTDRPPREGEEGEYQFVSGTSFLLAKATGQLIESIPIQPYFYGTSRRELRIALTRQPKKIAVWRGDVDGWPKVKAAAEKFRHCVARSIVIMPEMTFSELLVRMRESRKSERSLEERVRRAKYEIAKFQPDFLVMNPPEAGGQPTRAAEAVTVLFSVFLSRLGDIGYTSEVK